MAMKGMAEGELSISGEIIFKDDEVPEGPLPEPSTLVVKLVDAMKAGAPSINIANVEVDAHACYVKGQPLKYAMQVQNFKFGIFYSMSACLNIGWKRNETEWIRKGDYLNDRQHKICIREKTNEAVCSIQVKKY